MPPAPLVRGGPGPADGRRRARPARRSASTTWSPSWPGPADTTVGLVETAGGPRSPIAADGDSVDLCTALSPDVVVLVADAGLGAINAVRLSVDVLLTGCAPVLVLLNRWDGSDVQRRNREWLRRDGYQVTTAVADVAARITHARRDARAGFGDTWGMTFIQIIDDHTFDADSMRRRSSTGWRRPRASARPFASLRPGP